MIQMVGSEATTLVVIPFDAGMVFPERKSEAQSQTEKAGK